MKSDSDPSKEVWEAVFAVVAQIPIVECHYHYCFRAIWEAIRTAEPKAFDIYMGRGYCMPVWVHYHIRGDPFQKVIWLEPSDFGTNVHPVYRWIRELLRIDWFESVAREK